MTNLTNREKALEVAFCTFFIIDGKENPQEINEDKRYTVWVGDVEVNDYLMTFEKAQLLADVYIDDGYDDVQIEEV
jgi:hypothetical protein